MSTDQKDLPIKEGDCYIVATQFDDLKNGDVVRFVERGYNRYDGLSIFSFVDVEGYGHTIEVHDDAVPEVWREWSSKLLAVKTDSLDRQPPNKVTAVRIHKRSEIVMPYDQ